MASKSDTFLTRSCAFVIFLYYESVANHLCCYSGKVLENFTHHEEPWISARNGVFDLSPSDTIIPKDSIKAYFSIVKDKYKMKSPKDFQLYANDMFEQFIQI